MGLGDERPEPALEVIAPGTSARLIAHGQPAGEEHHGLAARPGADHGEHRRKTVHRADRSAFHLAHGIQRVGHDAPWTVRIARALAQVNGLDRGVVGPGITAAATERVGSEVLDQRRSGMDVDDLGGPQVVTRPERPAACANGRERTPNLFMVGGGRLMNGRRVGVQTDAIGGMQRAKEDANRLHRPLPHIRVEAHGIDHQNEVPTAAV